jgi:hypothetical protein
MRVRRRTLARELVALVLRARTRVNDWEKFPFSARNRTVDGRMIGYAFFEDAMFGRSVIKYTYNGVPEWSVYFNTHGERDKYW